MIVNQYGKVRSKRGNGIVTIPESKIISVHGNLNSQDGCGGYNSSKHTFHKVDYKENGRGNCSLGSATEFFGPTGEI